MPRKLTERQLFTLACVHRGHVVKRQFPKPVRRWGRPLVITGYWALDTDVTAQVKALKHRKMIAFDWQNNHAGNGRLVVTTLGQIELDKAGTKVKATT